MQITTVPLPNSPEPGSRAQFRHYVTLADGRVFYQDEQIHQDWKQMPTSERTVWQQLPAPPEPDTVVSVNQINTSEGPALVTFLRSGASYYWTDNEWQEWAPPVPGTIADANQ